MRCEKLACVWNLLNLLLLLLKWKLKFQWQLFLWSTVADSSPCKVTVLDGEMLPLLISKALKDSSLVSRNYLLLIICARAETAILLHSKLCRTLMSSAIEGVGKGFAALVPSQILPRCDSESGQQQTGWKGWGNTRCLEGLSCAQQG